MIQENLPLIEFGVKWEPHIRLVKDVQCPRCRFDFILGPLRDDYASYNNMIGFSTVIPKESSRDDIVGMMIYNCPQCQTQVWWHASVENINNILYLFENEGERSEKNGGRFSKMRDILSQETAEKLKLLVKDSK